MDNKIQVFTKYHWLALGVLLGISLVSAEIWYAVPSRAQSAQSSVPINNPSFETAIVSPGYPDDPCGLRWNSTSDWQFGNGSGVFQPFNPNTCGIILPPNVTTVAIIGYGSTMSQVLSKSPEDVQGYQPGYAVPGFYTLTFLIANKFPSYPGYYTAELDFGTQELCEISGWGKNTFAQIPLVCPSPGYLIVDKSLPGSGPPQGSSKLVIRFSSNAQAGWPLMLTKVSDLEFTPQ